MSPQHHLPPEVLLQYAMGSSGEAVSLVAATHLSLCPRCRQRLAEEEAFGGELLAGAPATPVSEVLLADLLGRLDVEAPQGRSSVDLERPSWMPAPLAQYVREAGGLRWRFVIPGVKRIELLPTKDQTRVRLYHLSPGVKVPFHDHAGEEYDQVLTGGFHDGQIHCVRGDLSVRSPGDRHALQVDRGEPCITLQVSAPLVPLTLAGRLFKLTGRD